MLRQPGSPFAQRDPRKGFSLLDIVIVVACLAILLSILFPILYQIRQAGYKARCSANLQQLSAAFSIYAQDWSDHWPCPGGKMGNWTYWAQSGNGGLEGYIKQRGYKTVWCCPLMPSWRSKYPPRSYSMNSYLREPADVEYPTCTGIIKGICSNRVLEPSRTILLFEGVPLTVAWEGNGYYEYIYRCCNWTGVRGYYDKVAYTIDPGSPWHGKVNNYVYADGHLRARRPGKYTVGVLSTYSEMREWYADKARYELTYQKNWSKLVPRD